MINDFISFYFVNLGFLFIFIEGEQKVKVFYQNFATINK